MNGRRLAKLSLAATGVVFGDIGTSPLYDIRACFHGEYGIVVSPASVLGVLSLMFWSLLMIVTFKYLIFILRVDNQKEGGVMALTALVLNYFGQGALLLTRSGFAGPAKYSRKLWIGRYFNRDWLLHNENLFSDEWRSSKWKINPLMSN